MKIKDDIIQWEQVRERIAVSGWAGRIHDQLKERTEGWMLRYQDDPDRVSGWGHNYFCDKCYRKIEFEPDRPGEHRCTHCGHHNVGQVYDEAWNYLYRDEVCKTVFYAAVLFRLHGDPRYLEWIRKVLGFYCDHYESLKVNVPEGYIGKIAGIDLCDAVHVIWLLQGMQLVKEAWHEEELERFKERLFLPEAELLHSHSLSINNIPCWMMSAVAMIGLFFGEEQWVEQAVHGKYGLVNQLAQGVTEEGFWLEGSVHYHFYCAEPFVYVLHFARMAGMELPEVGRNVRRMYEYPVQLAFRNGRFPNPNDGWPLVSFSAYAGQYEWMNALYPAPSYEHALSASYDGHYVPGFAFGGMCDSQPDGWVQRLLFGSDQYASLDQGDRPSRCDRDIQFALLRDDNAELFVKFGFHQRNHSHPDVMNIELSLQEEIVSYDISNSGYGSVLFREWQRKTVAHNTVVVDAHDQEAREKGSVEWFDAAQGGGRFRSRGVYPGVDYVRELQLTDGGFTDMFEVISEEEHTMDWVFHCAGELHCGHPTAASASPGVEDGYQHLLNVRRFATDEAWSVSWQLEDKAVHLRMEACEGTEVYWFEGYEYTSEKKRPGVLVRRRGPGTVYRSNFSFVLGS